MPTTDPFVATLRNWIEVFMRRSMHNFIRYSRESGISMPQVGALFHIHRGAGGVSDLGEGLGITSAAASQMLERLVQQGVILRSEAPHDRRVKQIVLTEKGRHILQESFHAHQGWLDDLAQTLSAGEKEQIVDALKILIEKANRLEAPSEPQPARTG
jgi:DNA-binding MarR family transcriptional regulator